MTAGLPVRMLALECRGPRRILPPLSVFDSQGGYSVRDLTEWAAPGRSMF